MMVARTKFTPRQCQALDVRHDIRRAKMAKVKIAIKQLDMDDHSYRAMLERITGNRTLTLCLENEIDDVIRELERLGFTAKAPKSAASPRKLDDSPEGKLIRAIWLQLHAIGEVKNPSEAALMAYVLRVGKVSAIQWLSASKTELVIETLKKWAVRVFPTKLADLWRELAAEGKRSAYEARLLDHFIVANAGRNEPYTYANLLSCWEKLQAERKEAAHG